MEQSRAIGSSRWRIFLCMIWVNSCINITFSHLTPFPRRIVVRPRIKLINFCLLRKNDGGRGQKAPTYQLGFNCSNDGAPPAKKGYKANKRKKRRKDERRRKWPGLGSEFSVVASGQRGGVPLETSVLHGCDLYYDGEAKFKRKNRIVNRPFMMDNWGTPSEKNIYGTKHYREQADHFNGKNFYKLVEEKVLGLNNFDIKAKKTLFVINLDVYIYNQSYL